MPAKTAATAATAKPAAPAAEKKPAAAAAPAAEKKPAAAAEKKPAAAAEKKPATTEKKDKPAAAAASSEKKAVEKKPAAEKKTEEKKPEVELVVCDGCKGKYKGEKGLSIHQSTSTLCPKSSKYDAEAAKKAAEKKESAPKKDGEKRERKPRGEKKDTTATTEKKDGAAPAKKTEKKPAAEKKKIEVVICDGCKGKFNGEKGVATHQASSSVCPKSSKYDAESAKKAAEKKDERQKNRNGLDTKCPKCDSMHKGEKGLAIHLAKNTKCPGSAAYEKKE